MTLVSTLLYIACNSNCVIKVIMVTKSSLRDANYIYLVGHPSSQIVGSKLPSIQQVLSVFFYNMREVKLNINESSKLVIKEVSVFWQKARIPIKAEQHCISKLQKYYYEWRDLQKLQHRKTETQQKKNEQFISTLNDLFDIAQADALNIMKIEEDRSFLISQRQKNRPGSMLGVDLKITRKEERAAERLKVFEENRKRTYSEMEIASELNY